MAEEDQQEEIMYSDKYADDTHEYRHVTLPKSLIDQMPKDRLLSEDEWRGLGVCQSLGWVHYMIHRPEPWILLFRRPLDTDPRTGRPIVQSKRQKEAKRHNMRLRHHDNGSEENDSRHSNMRDNDEEGAGDDDQC